MPPQPTKLARRLLRHCGSGVLPPPAPPPPPPPQPQAVQLAPKSAIARPRSSAHPQPQPNLEQGASAASLRDALLELGDVPDESEVERPLLLHERIHIEASETEDRAADLAPQSANRAPPDLWRAGTDDCEST